MKNYSTENSRRLKMIFVVILTVLISQCMGIGDNVIQIDQCQISCGNKQLLSGHSAFQGSQVPGKRGPIGLPGIQGPPGKPYPPEQLVDITERIDELSNRMNALLAETRRQSLIAMRDHRLQLLMADSMEQLSAIRTELNETNIRLGQTEYRLNETIAQINAKTIETSFPKDCASAQLSQMNDAIIVIKPRDDSSDAVRVLCDMTTDSGGWTIIQTRFDGSQTFDLDWESYEEGFGIPESEYWAGLKNMHEMTKHGDQELRIQLEDVDGNVGYATYSNFVVGSTVSDYTLNVVGYEGNVGNALVDHGYPKEISNGMKFTTKDRDNDNSSANNCAITHGPRGGWWFSACHRGNLNGDFTKPGSWDGIVWHNWGNSLRAIKKTTMMIRPRQ